MQFAFFSIVLALWTCDLDEVRFARVLLEALKVCINDSTRTHARTNEALEIHFSQPVVARVKKKARQEHLQYQKTYLTLIFAVQHNVTAEEVLYYLANKQHLPLPDKQYKTHSLRQASLVPLLDTNPVCLSLAERIKRITSLIVHIEETSTNG